MLAASLNVPARSHADRSCIYFYLLDFYDKINVESLVVVTGISSSISLSLISTNSKTNIVPSLQFSMGLFTVEGQLAKENNKE